MKDITKVYDFKSLRVFLHWKDFGQSFEIYIAPSKAVKVILLIGKASIWIHKKP